jgi:tetratricopeptide (TPR) repeat protein
VLRWGGAGGIVIVAVLRVCASFAPQLVSDADPALDPSPLGGFGPAGSLLLDALLLVACAAGLFGETLAGRRIDWRIVALALVPVPAVIWHGAGDLGDLWRGATWAAAAAGCCVIAHLGRDRAMRPLLLALLLAVLVPVAVRGAGQSAVSLGPIEIEGPEHAATVDAFERSRDRFLADRGWPPDSPAALIYERRLRSADPRGWFPTSNIFASLMAVGVVVFAGLALDGVSRRRRGWIAGFGAAAVVALGGLVVAGSKGGLGAAALGVALLLLVHVFRDRVAGWVSPRLAGAVALGLVALALLAVTFRGTTLPESFLGDRSLLFRWHYLQGAGRIVADEGWRGVGPDGFQAAYVTVRSPRSPEEVTSAHSVFADWLATLGVLGLGWVGLVGTSLWRAGRRLRSPGEGPAPPLHERAPLLAAALCAILGLIPAMAAEYHQLGFADEVIRWIGVLGFVIAAAVLGAAFGGLSTGAADRALAAAAIALVVHGQIEMTFFDPGSVVWAMCLLGLATPVADEGGGPPWVGSAGTAAFLGLSIWIGTIWTPRVFRQERLMVEAARVVAKAPDERIAVPDARRAAAETLEVAWQQCPTGLRPLAEAARQWLIAAASTADREPRHHALDQAVTLAERAVDLRGTPGAHALAAEARAMRAEELVGAEDLEQAIVHARRLTEIDPHGIGVWVRLGDLLWDADRRGEAAAAYQRALENSDNFELDPLKQLGQPESHRLNERIAETV